MRHLLTLLSIAAIAGAGGGAARAERVSPPPPTLADVQTALAAGQISEARRLGEQLVAAHPDDAKAAYFAASGDMAVGLLDEGLAHLDAALAKHPGEADLYGLRGSISQLRGDDAAARDAVGKALAIDPAQEDALEVKRELDLADAYVKHTTPALAPGSGPALVASLLGKIATGAPPEDVADFFDPAILTNAPGGLPPTRDSLVALVRGAYEAADAQMSAGSYAFVAYRVAPDAPGDVVTVDLLIENRWTAERVAMMKKLFEDPQGRAMLDAESRQIFEGLDPGDRDAAFSRLIGTRRRALATMEVPVVAKGSSWVVSDLELNGMSIRDQLLPLLPSLMAKTGISPGAGPYVPSSFAPRSRFPTSALVGIFAGLAGLISLLVRRSRGA
jgi:hypothetical protein